MRSCACLPVCVIVLRSWCCLFNASSRFVEDNHSIAASWFRVRVFKRSWTLMKTAVMEMAAGEQS
eukprot:6382340-Prorocentrum_lima.AAC.1